jgi:hypothetical protein
MNIQSINPYYSPELLELDMISFDQPDLSYEYNTLCFWATKDGRVFYATDSGCSCPTPFEDYEGQTTDQVIQILERVGSVEQAEKIFNSWNEGYGDGEFLTASDRRACCAWVSAHLKNA